MQWWNLRRWCPKCHKLKHVEAANQAAALFWQQQCHKYTYPRNHPRSPVCCCAHCDAVVRPTPLLCEHFTIRIPSACDHCKLELLLAQNAILRLSFANPMKVKTSAQMQWRSLSFCTRNHISVQLNLAGCDQPVWTAPSTTLKRIDEPFHNVKTGTTFVSIRQVVAAKQNDKHATETPTIHNSASEHVHILIRSCGYGAQNQHPQHGTGNKRMLAKRYNSRPQMSKPQSGQNQFNRPICWWWCNLIGIKLKFKKKLNTKLLPRQWKAICDEGSDPTSSSQSQTQAHTHTRIRPHRHTNKHIDTQTKPHSDQALRHTHHAHTQTHTREWDTKGR